MVDTRSAAATVPGGLEAAALRGLGSTSFSSRLLAHDRRPTELELRNGMTLASWRAARGTAGWEWGVGDQRGGAVGCGTSGAGGRAAGCRPARTLMSSGNPCLGHAANTVPAALHAGEFEAAIALISGFLLDVNPRDTVRSADSFPRSNRSPGWHDIETAA